MVRKTDGYVPSWAGGIEPADGIVSVEEILPPSPPEVDDPKTLSTHERVELKRLLAEIANRKLDALRLYQPQAHQLPIHQSNAQERLVFGSNQSGKTTSSCVELAWVVTNSHPWLKYPAKGEAFVVGNDQKQLAHTILPKLIEPIVTLRRIRDLQTGEWRQYQPKLDADRYEESVPMGPLIPQRMIRNISWENFGQKIPATIEMKNGWKITFFTAAGKPPQGATIDFAMLDEEVGDAWYDEISPRLMAKKGRMIWSATPQVGGRKLLQFHERCQQQALLPKEQRSSEEFFMLLANNEHIDEEEKDKLAEKYKHDPDQYRVRILGQFLLMGGLMYPQWSEAAHVVDGFAIPEDWCRYMVVDPGHTVCCVLFVAVPPPQDVEHGGHVYIFKELYLRECDPSKFANAVRHVIGSDVYQAFIIDDHGSRRHDGVGMNMRAAYDQALRALGISSVETGSGFIHVNADVEAGCTMVREMLGTTVAHGDQARQKLQVFRDCDNMRMEFKMYFKKRDPSTGIWLDKPDQRANHAMDCARYTAMHGVPYVKPRRRGESKVSRLLRRLRGRREETSAIYVCAGSGQ